MEKITQNPLLNFCKSENKRRKPDVKGSISVAGWFEETKDGKRYLNLRIGDSLYVRLFPSEEGR
ncbi:MAG: hypothetical protein QXF56_00915 [Candidatus Micrarchaeia archaeon]